MSELINFAKRELDIIGLGSDPEDQMDLSMRDHLLKMVEIFSDEGHSGFSASYAVALLSKILKFEPLTPLTGEDSEWNLVSEEEELYQNNRCFRVFKKAGQAYDIDGKVFIDGRGPYTSSQSSVNITFPYVPKTEYVRLSEE